MSRSCVCLDTRIPLHLLEMTPGNNPTHNSTSRRNHSVEEDLQAGVSDGAGPVFSHILDLRKAFACDSLVAEQRLIGYYERYSLAFPDETERSVFSRLHQSLSNPNSSLQIFAFMVGDEIAGGTHFKILQLGECAFGVLEYIWVSPESRGRNLGSAICGTLDRFLSSRGAICSVAEFHDPALSSPEARGIDSRAGVTAEGRLQFWKKMGYQALDVPYICPPVVGQSVWNLDSLLGVKVLNEAQFQTIATGQGYLGMVRAYWDTFDATYASSKVYHRLVERVESLQRLELIPLDSPRSRSSYL